MTFSTEMVSRFLNQPVTVETVDDHVHGVLKGVEKSQHNGIDSLLLRNRDFWVLIKVWVAIKRDSTSADVQRRIGKHEKTRV